MRRTDIVVIGGGCVGLATAYQILKKEPWRDIIVLEKESKVATHQTGRNSGVIHSGIYYKPGSLKATNCREGKVALEEFCKTNQIPFQKVGKLIVANGPDEEERLHNILQRGKENGVDCKLVTKEEMLKIEPNVSGTEAIHVPETGIVDFRKVCECLVEKIEYRNGRGAVYRFEKVIDIEHRGCDRNVLVTTQINGVYDHFHCNTVINCAGLYADHIAHMAGYDPKIKIIPFRGEYYTLSSEAVPLVKGLIYPVPDPRFPFLGVHFTKMINGGVECGPNAVLAFGREGYNKTDFHLWEFLETMFYPGFWKLSFKFWKTGLQETLRSFFKSRYTQSLKKLVPAVEQEHLIANRPAGIRAQAVTRDGSLVDDFLVEKHNNVIHVLNTPSPAATACLAIGKYVAKKLEE